MSGWLRLTESGVRSGFILRSDARSHQKLEVCERVALVKAVDSSLKSL